MDKDTLKDLEYNKILHILQGLCVSPLGGELALELKPLRDMDEIERRLSQVMELQEILKETDIPIHLLKDIRQPLKRLEKEGDTLSPADFMIISGAIETAERLKGFFKDRGGGLLCEEAEGLLVPDSLLKSIKDTFDEEGAVKDTASSELLKRRKDAVHVKEEIRRFLAGMLERKDLGKAFADRIITVRGGRYVLAVKRDYQSAIVGIVHDESQSGSTYYIEPMESLHLNNRLTILLKRCEEEERRILEDLMQKARADLEDLNLMSKQLAWWDLLYAKARLGTTLDSVKPHINSSGRVDLRKARHPLLVLSKQDRVVPVDIKFEEGKRIIVVSGANTGGKTVSLKTLGILTLMLQSGLTIPADASSHMAVFDKVLADIGDDQSIEDKMSTFSAHMQRMAVILEQAGANCLVLIDEIGTGTDPGEGAVLALSMLECLKEKKTTVMVTTHYSDLKLFAYHDGSAENLSVEFNAKTKKPTFRLVSGIPGASNAFSIAGSYGIPLQVVKRARGYLKGGRGGLTELLEALHRDRSAVSDEKKRVKRLRSALDSLKKRKEKLLDELEGKKAKILERARSEAVKSKKEFKKRAERIIKSLQQENARGLKGVFKKLDAAENDAFGGGFKKKVVTYRPSEDEMVYLPSLKEKGVVKAVTGRYVEVQTGHFKVKLGFTEIEPLKAADGSRAKGGRPGSGVTKKAAFETKQRETPRKEMPFELKVIGLRTEDAVKEVDRFIDRTILNGLERASIIHGKGEGRLRKAIHEYLGTHPAVRSFAVEEFNHGVTTVVFGDKKEIKQREEI